MPAFQGWGEHGMRGSVESNSPSSLGEVQTGKQVFSSPDKWRVPASKGSRVHNTVGSSTRAFKHQETHLHSPKLPVLK